MTGLTARAWLVACAQDAALMDAFSERLRVMLVRS